MGAFTVIRAPAFDLLAADYAREHPRLKDDLDWLAGRLAEAPEPMGDHVPELGPLALPIFKTRCKDSCHKIGASGAWRIYYALHKRRRKCSCFFCITRRNTRIPARNSCSRKWSAHLPARRNPSRAHDETRGQPSGWARCCGIGRSSSRIDDLTNYRRPRVQLHVQGIVLRDEVPGALIKTKTQQVCRAGEFLVAEIDAEGRRFRHRAGVAQRRQSSAATISCLSLMKRSSTGAFSISSFARQHSASRSRAQGSTNYAAIRPAHVLATKSRCRRWRSSGGWWRGLRNWPPKSTKPAPSATKPPKKPRHLFHRKSRRNLISEPTEHGFR